MGTELTKFHLPSKIDPGITIESTIGVVPEYEEREAAVYTICPWHIWCDLPWWERASGVAHFRTHSLLEQHYSDASEQAAKKAQPQAPNYAQFAGRR